MKKSIFAVLALFLIAACGIGLAQSQINALGDDVTIEETVLAGDKKAAEGISVTTKAQYEGTPMFWETAYTVGEKADLSCEFQYKSNRHNTWGRDPYSNVSFYTEPSDDEEWNAEYDGETVDFEECLSTPEELVRPVIDKTKDGKAHRETVYIKEQLPYYRVTLSYSTHDETGGGLVFYDNEEASEYFRIPVQDDDRLEVAVSKKEDGSCKYVKIKGEKISYVETAGVGTEEAVYLFLTDMYSYTEKTDRKERVTLPSRLCGIHRIPLKEAENPYGTMKFQADYDNASLVSPMKQGCNVMKPFFSADGESLMAFSVEDERVNLLVFDAKSFKLKQEIYLTTYDKEDELYWDDDSFVVRDEGNHMLVTLMNNQFSFLTKNKEGDWQLELTDRLLLNGEPEFLADEELAFVYRDDTLALACLHRKEKYIDEWDQIWGTASSFQLSVYENDQRVYDGFYESSLDALVDDRGYGLGAVAIDRTPITLSLPSAASKSQQPA